MNYMGQIFGNRKVVRNECLKSDWTNLGLRVPTRPDKYILTECLNCGTIIPCNIRYLHYQPPKKCVMCSNIGNHSNIKTKTNTWVLYNDYAVCNVTYGKEIVSFYIDIPDYINVSCHTWRVSKKKQKYYIISGSSKKGTMQYLHDYVLGLDKNGAEIDHIDGNSLNNRKNNLRFVTRQENIDNQRATRIDNRIGIRGIVYNKANRKFKVDFHYHKKRYYTKDWDSIEEAVWCRYCLENYFGLMSIKNNPLAEQYYTLDEQEKNIIHKYVLEKILGNER